MAILKTELNFFAIVFSYIQHTSLQSFNFPKPTFLFDQWSKSSILYNAPPLTIDILHYMYKSHHNFVHEKSNTLPLYYWAYHSSAVYLTNEIKIVNEFIPTHGDASKTTEQLKNNTNNHVIRWFSLHSAQIDLVPHQSTFHKV